MILHLHAEAEVELEEAFDHYQRASRGLGVEFLEEYVRGTRKVIEAPERWPWISARARRYRLTRFPYSLVYEIRPDCIMVLAIAHASRQPGYWEHRK